MRLEDVVKCIEQRKDIPVLQKRSLIDEIYTLPDDAHMTNIDIRSIVAEVLRVVFDIDICSIEPNQRHLLDSIIVEYK